MIANLKICHGKQFQAFSILLCIRNVGKGILCLPLYLKFLSMLYVANADGKYPCAYIILPIFFNVLHKSMGIGAWR